MINDNLKKEKMSKDFFYSRSSEVTPPGPAYKIRSTPDFTEATFVFPSNSSNGSGSLPLYPALQLASAGNCNEDKSIGSFLFFPLKEMSISV